MPALKQFDQMKKPSNSEKDTKSKGGYDPVEALDGLWRALESEDGFVLLTGPAGAGKSKLVQELLPRLTCMVCQVAIPDKEMTNRDFRQFLAEALGVEAMVQSRGAFLLKIRDFLTSEAVKDHRIVLVLESIQCLDKKLFKELELLSDIRIHDRSPITFLFVGLAEAESIFSDPHLAKIASQICARIRLEDADFDDIGSFKEVQRHIRERLRQAGALEPVFDASAVSEIYRLSRGRLWAVDGLCDLALLNGERHGLKKISAAVVGEYTRQLGLPVKGDGDRESFQRNLESVRRELRSVLDDNAPPEPDVRAEPEATPPPGSGPEPDAAQVGVNHFQERDWEDRVLENYIDGAHLERSPVRQRAEGQFYDSAAEHGGGIDDGWEKDPVANGPALNRSSFMWGAVGVISLLLLFFAVWIQFFDESGSLARFFTDTTAKIESTLRSVWQGDKDDASPETAAKTPLPSSETDTPEPANPASPGRDSAADDRLLETGGALVEFESDSYAIGPEYAKLLDQVAAYLERHPEQSVSLRGYADNTGSREHNLFISKYQALVVKYYLIGKGVPAERMQILGMGEGIPIDSNDSPEGRRHNRRVDIKLIPSPLKRQPDTPPGDPAAQ